MPTHIYLAVTPSPAPESGLVVGPVSAIPPEIRIRAKPWIVSKLSSPSVVAEVSVIRIVQRRVSPGRSSTRRGVYKTLASRIPAIVGTIHAINVIAAGKFMVRACDIRPHKDREQKQKNCA